MKNFKKVLALVLAVVMLLSFATIASAVTSDYYEDAADIDYKEAVDVLGSIGVLNGFPDDTFRPDATITRAQAAKIIAMFDNGSTDINKLYTAANPFADCVDHWAESYIAYGVKTGIIAGIGGDKFAPEANVTGVQYLKMVLVVLGYDAKAEGLEGKNWDVNTLALAKRVGLTATLGNKFDYSADLARQEAAVIMLDALRADVVEYGSRLGSNGVVINEWPYVKSGTIYWTVTGAISTGKQLMDAWKLAEGYTVDAFARPYATWTLKGKEIGRYMYPVYAEYTTGVDLCTVYTDLGVEKTDYRTTLDVEHFVNGVEVDPPVNNHHDIGDPCKLKTEGVGSQGTLTQIFLMDDGTYRVTEIETWLGRVSNVQKTTSNRDGHLINDKLVTIEVAFGDYPNDYGMEVELYSDAYSKGEWVLITYSEMEKGANSDRVYGLQSVTSAEVETAQFTGIAADATKVAAEWKADAYHFFIGYTGSAYGKGFPYIDGFARVKLPENLKGTFKFIYDTYGNVIGMVEPDAAPYDYLVIDWMYMTANVGDAVLNADVVGLDAKMTNAVNVAKLDGHTPDFWISGTMSQYGPEYGNNWSGRYDKLYTYQTDADGAYYVTTANGAQREAVSIINNKANLFVNNVASEFVLTDDTQILVHEMDGSYTAATGKDVGTIYAANAEIIADSDNIVSIVYLYGSYVFRESSKTTGFVAAGVTEPPVIEVIDGLEVTKLNVYFNGELKQIYVESKAWNEVFYHGDGFYTFRFVDQLSDGAMLCDVADFDADASVEYTVTFLSGNTMIANGAAYKVAADVTIYDVYGGVVTPATELTSNTVMLGFNGSGVVTTIYCLAD